MKEPGEGKKEKGANDLQDQLPSEDQAEEVAPPEEPDEGEDQNLQDEHDNKPPSKDNCEETTTLVQLGEGKEKRIEGHQDQPPSEDQPVNRTSAEELGKVTDQTCEDDHQDQPPSEDQPVNRTSAEELGKVTDQTCEDDHQDQSPLPMKYLQMREVSISTEEMSMSSIIRASDKKHSRDAGTNTASTIASRTRIADDICDLEEFKTEEEKNHNCIKGLIDCHIWALGILPTQKKFLFCIPLRYGVYTIISCEEVYFFLRSYSRVLLLAMPYFFPELTSWLATTELLLCLATMVSGVFLLYGVFINPMYMFIWIDIHLLEMFIYIFLSLWLVINGSEPLYQFPLLYTAYILAFMYSIVIVNSFHRHWDTARPTPSDTGPSSQVLV